MNENDKSPTTFKDGFEQTMELVGMLIQCLIALVAILACGGLLVYGVLRGFYELIRWSPLWGSLIVVGVVSIPGAGIVGGIIASRRGRQKTDCDTPIQKEVEDVSSEAPHHVTMWKME
jgi:hypothetical protein